MWVHATARVQVMRPRSPHWATRVLEVSSLSHVSSPPPSFDIGGETGDDGDGIAEGDASRAGGGAGDGAGGGAGSGGLEARGGDADPPKSGRARRRALRPADSVATVADTLDEFRQTMEDAGALARRRHAQATLAVRAHAFAALLERLGEESDVEALVTALAAQTAEGSLAASQAGAQIAAKVLGESAMGPAAPQSLQTVCSQSARRHGCETNHAR